MKNVMCAKVMYALVALSTCLQATQFHFAVQTNDGKLKAVNAKEAITTAINTVDPQLLACALDECARTGEPVHLLPILKQLNTHIEYYRSARYMLRVFGVFAEMYAGVGLVIAAFLGRVRYIGFAGTLIFIDGIRRAIVGNREELAAMTSKPPDVFASAKRLLPLLDVLRAHKDMLIVDDAEALQVKLECRKLKKLRGVELWGA